MQTRNIWDYYLNSNTLENWKVHRRMFLKIGIIFLLSISIFIQPIPNCTASKNLPFPETISKMERTKYKFTQIMEHWNGKTYLGNGTIILHYHHDVPDYLEIEGDYDIHVWQRACDRVSIFSGKVTTIHNKTTRLTIATPETVGTMDQTGTHTNLYLGNAFQTGYSTAFFIDDLMYMHGEIFEIEFEKMGEIEISVMDDLIKTTHIHWSGQIIYAGYICGIGAAPIFNVSVDYYYEPNTGILLYSDARYMEYLPSDPTVYQDHHIEKTLIDYKYEGQPSDDSDDTPFDDFINDLTGGTKEGFYALIIITCIICAGIIAMIAINKRSKRWNREALKRFEKEFGDPDKIIQETEKKLNQSPEK